jgi:hypothetical protein
MRKDDSEQALRRQFCEFIVADPVPPPKQLDESVRRRVAADLRPAPWKIFVRLAAIQVAAGLVTLALCPQFGLGFGGGNELLHDLHITTSPAVFHLLCGVLFVIFGAALGGLVLTRQQIRAIRSTRYGYFAVYSVLAYLALVTLGPEVFVFGSLLWLVGAMLGNVLGYGAAIRLRQVFLNR